MGFSDVKTQRRRRLQNSIWNWLVVKGDACSQTCIFSATEIGNGLWEAITDRNSFRNGRILTSVTQTLCNRCSSRPLQEVHIGNGRCCAEVEVEPATLMGKGRQTTTVTNGCPCNGHQGPVTNAAWPIWGFHGVKANHEKVKVKKTECQNLRFTKEQYLMVNVEHC